MWYLFAVSEMEWATKKLSVRPCSSNKNISLLEWAGFELVMLEQNAVLSQLSPEPPSGAKCMVGFAARSQHLYYNCAPAKADASVLWWGPASN